MAHREGFAAEPALSLWFFQVDSAAYASVVYAGLWLWKMEVHYMTSMPPTSSAPSGVTATLAVVDIVVLAVYFLLILAVGIWVSLEDERLLLQ